jgi:hypothetical protein
MDGGKLLIGSDLPDRLAARRELECWAAENGYHLPRDARQLSVFDQGTLVREWVVVEALPGRRGRSSAFSFNPLSLLRAGRRETADGAAAPRKRAV